MIIQVAIILSFSSCSILEKSSSNGFNSGCYKLQSQQKTTKMFI